MEIIIWSRTFNESSLTQRYSSGATLTSSTYNECILHADTLYACTVAFELSILWVYMACDILFKLMTPPGLAESDRTQNLIEHSNMCSKRKIYSGRRTMTCFIVHCSVIHNNSLLYIFKKYQNKSCFDSSTAITII